MCSDTLADDRQAIGAALPREEDLALLTGEAQFVDDFAPPGLMHAKFARSPIAHGQIVSVDVTDARQLPGVLEVLVGDELAARPLTPSVQNPDITNVPRPILANDRVRFAGEAIAVVVADDPYVAEDAVDLIDIQIDPLPVITDMEDALGDSSPRLHDIPSNMVFDRSYECGDVEAILGEAPVRVDRTFHPGRQSAVPIEPRGILATPEAGGVRVQSSTQVPTRLCQVLIDLLDLPPELLQVSTPDVGGAFGQKGHVYPEDVAITRLAWRLSRPVKWIEDRTENLLASTHARDQQTHVRVGADTDGRILALDAGVASNLGAYPSESHGPLIEAGITPSTLPGPYDIGAYRYRSRAVCTNTCPHGAYRGVGQPAAAFSHERIMNIVADTVGIDPIEVRRRNLVPTESMPYTSASGRVYDTGDYCRALNLAAREMLPVYERRRAQAVSRPLTRVGLGFASFVEYSGVNSTELKKRGMEGVRGDDTAHARLNDDGTIDLWTSLPAVGQGNATTFRQIASDAFGVAPARICVRRTDTAVAEMVGHGTGASRSMVSGGGAVFNVSRELADRVCEDAGQRLGIPAREVVFGDDGLYGQGSNECARYVDLIKSAEPDRYHVTSLFDPPQVVYSYATHACVVEVDTESGEVHICDYVVADDCGRVINPMIVHGQVRGGVAQGIGASLFEQHKYDVNGQLQTASLMDYLLPTSTDVPNIHIESFEIPTPGSLLGVKGVGESGAIGPPAAVANAVAHATGAEVNAVPITPESVRFASAVAIRDEGVT